MVKSKQKELVKETIKEIEKIRPMETTEKIIDNIMDFSWYALYMVWIIIVIGVLSMIFLNIYFKIVGLFTFFIGMFVLLSIIRAIQGGKIKWKEIK